MRKVLVERRRSPAPASKMAFPVEGAVLDGFSDVFGGNFRQAVQVGDGAGDFQNPVMGPRAEPHLVDRQRHDLLRRVIQRAILLERCQWVHMDQ